MGNTGAGVRYKHCIQVHHYLIVAKYSHPLPIEFADKHSELSLLTLATMEATLTTGYRESAFGQTCNLDVVLHTNKALLSSKYSRKACQGSAHDKDQTVNLIPGNALDSLVLYCRASPTVSM